MIETTTHFCSVLRINLIELLQKSITLSLWYHTNNSSREDLNWDIQFWISSQICIDNALGRSLSRTRSAKTLVFDQETICKSVFKTIVYLGHRDCSYGKKLITSSYRQVLNTLNTWNRFIAHRVVSVRNYHFKCSPCLTWDRGRHYSLFRVLHRVVLARVGLGVLGRGLLFSLVVSISHLFKLHLLLPFFFFSSFSFSSFNLLPRMHPHPRLFSF